MSKGVYDHWHLVPKIYKPELVDRVKTLYEAGHTQTEIGEIVGLSQKVIWNLMRNHGILARVAAKRDQRGDKNHMWKGSDASYTAFHTRLYKEYGKPTWCEECGTTDSNVTYDWANLTGRYDDIDDYKRLCRSCHSKLDNKIKNLGQYAERKEVPYV